MLFGVGRCGRERALHERNIDDLFHRAGQRIGEGLEMEFWQAHYDAEDPHRPKLELFLILQNQQAWENLEEACETRIHALFSQHKQAIHGLKSSEREQYNRVRELAKTPEALEFALPAEITVKVSDDGFAAYNKHLYVDDQGGYQSKLNTWEAATIQAEIERSDVLGWLRNYERKPWSLSMPYEDGANVLPMYPDFLVVRETTGGLVVDILEPHSSALADSWKKARGLAKYAKTHSLDASLGRIEMIRKTSAGLQRLTLNESSVQDKVLSWVTSNEHLDQMFDEIP